MSLIDQSRPSMNWAAILAIAVFARLGAMDPRTSRAHSDLEWAIGDSVRILITNGMGHPMTLSYQTDSVRIPLGTIDGGAEKIVVIRDLHVDSVTVWASNFVPPHDLSKKFPTHTSALMTWTF